jgi:capsular exopolysaccharide synthesis family protein
MAIADLNAPNLRLSDLLRILRRRWAMIAVTTGVITALLLGVSLSQPKQYTASARVLEQTVSSETAVQADPDAAVPFFADRQVKNAVDVILSTNLRDAVAKQYHGKLDVDQVTATPQAVGSDAIDISVTARSPSGAADLVNLYAKTYIAQSTKARSSALSTGQAAITKQIAGVDAERTRIGKELDRANAQGSDQAQSLVQQLSTLDIQRSSYVQRLQSLQLSAGLTGVQSAELVSKADPPTDPVSPKPVRDGIIGLMLGLGLGIAIALARDFLDDSVRTSSDLDALTDATVPTLGIVPRFDGASSGIATVSTPASLPAEAFRAVRTSVRFVALDRAMKVIQVTSTSAGEGKTTVVANLAAALAQAGHRVAVVSCDLRRPDLHRRFEESSSPGLTDVLLGECLLSEAMRKTASGVYLLASGPRPPNPSELLGSSRMKVVLDFLVSEFDFVLLDSTPVLAVTDAVVVSQFAQATLVVVAARDTPRQRVREALDVLIRAGAPLAGLILNKANARDGGSYDYYDLGQDEPKRAWTTRPASGPMRPRVRADA